MRYKLDYKFWLGIGVSLFFMALLLRKIDFGAMKTALFSADYRFIVLAVCFTFVNYFLRAVRWRYLLIQEKTIRLSSLYSATVIGYMANNLLPARLGEFIRAYTLAKREQLEAATVFASLVIDRLCDGFTVLVILVFTLFTITLPPGMEEAAGALKTGGVVTFLLYCSIMLFLFFLKKQTNRTLTAVSFVLKPFGQHRAEKLIQHLEAFIGGIRLSMRGSHLAALLLSSGGIWLFCVLPVDMTLRAFNIHLPMTASLFILILLVFAVMVPASPGFIGTYHYACYKGLSVFGVPETTSVSIALIIHGISFFPVIVVGLYYLWRNKLSLNGLNNNADTTLANKMQA